MPTVESSGGVRGYSNGAVSVTTVGSGSVYLLCGARHTTAPSLSAITLDLVPATSITLINRHDEASGGSEAGLYLAVWDDTDAPAAAGTYSVVPTWDTASTTVYLWYEASSSAQILPIASLQSAEYEDYNTQALSIDVTSSIGDLAIFGWIGTDASSLRLEGIDSPSANLQDQIESATVYYDARMVAMHDASMASATETLSGSVTFNGTGASGDSLINFAFAIKAATAAGTSEELLVMSGGTTTLPSIDTIAAIEELLLPLAVTSGLESIDTSAATVIDMDPMAVSTAMPDADAIAATLVELLSLSIATTMEDVDAIAATVLELLALGTSSTLQDIDISNDVIEELLALEGGIIAFGSIDLIAATVMDLEAMATTVAIEAVELSTIGNTEELLTLATSTVLETIETIQPIVEVLEALSTADNLLDIEVIQPTSEELVEMTVSTILESIDETQATNYELVALSFTEAMQAIDLTGVTTNPGQEPVMVKAMIRDMVQ